MDERVDQMDRYQSEDDGVPQHILDDIEAGLDDLAHSRGVEGSVVLARLDAIIETARARRAAANRNGETGSNSPTAD